jgi:Arc-like DNA binding domain
VPRPKTGKTPQRNVRVPDAVWQRAKARAEKEGRSISDVLRECLDEYTGKYDQNRR